MLSVTSEAASSASFQTTRQKPARDDSPPPGDSFGALVDANAQASQVAAQASDQQDASPDRRTPDAAPVPSSRSDNAATNDNSAQPRGSNASSGQPPRTDSAGTGFQKPATDKDASTGVAGHPAKPTGGKVATAKDASNSDLVASDVTTADPTAATQPIAEPIAVAVAVTIPLAATPSTASTTPAATAATGSATEAPQAAAMLLTQQTDAKAGKPATTGFNPAVTAETAAATAPVIQDAKATPDASQTAQPSSGQTGFEGEALAAAIAAATPAAAKATAKTTDNAQPAKTTSSVVTGLQPGPVDMDLTATSATSGSPVATHDATAGDYKHDAVTADSAKTVSSDAGTLAPQPGAAAPQHPAQTTDAALQPPPGQTDSGQQQGINSALAQPQVQSTAATSPATLQYNVAVAVGAAVPLNGLAVQIAFTAQSGKSRFEIRLDPADLGRIDVRLDVDRQGRVTSHLTVEKPETLAMLRQDAPQLQRALQDAGLKTGDGGLQFSLRDQSSQGQTARDDTGRNAQRLIVTENDVVPAATAGRSYGRMLGSSGGLDIRV